MKKKTLCKILAFLVVLFGMMALAFYRKGLFKQPDFSLLEDKKETSKLFDKNGKVIREYCLYCREITKLEGMKGFPGLVIATEDKNFWTRPFAFDIWGIARAAKQDIKTWKTNQGGSTITQQAARNLLLQEELSEEREAKDNGSKWDYVKTKWWRKAREILVARELEQLLSRKEILELYLNSFYCGNGRYGATACSHYYFDKPVKDLDTAEAAFIIGLLRKPGLAAFAKQSKTQEMLAMRNRVLGQLKNQDVINDGELRALAKRPLPNHPFLDRPERAAHFAEYVRREIVKDGKLVDMGYSVYTTIDSNLQKVATEALRRSIVAMQERNPELKDLRGAAIMLDAKTGAMSIFAQWPPFRENEYLANQIRRHAGSTFKPFQYTAMIEKKRWRLSCNDEGGGPCGLDDSPRLAVSMGHGQKIHYIQNFPYQGIPRYRGITEPLTAIGESRNAATMSAVAGVRNSNVPKEYRVKKEEIIDVAVRLGIQKPEVDPGLTVGIGSIDVSPLEMAVACAGFLGNKVAPYAIQRIDNAGRTIYEAAPQPSRPVLEERVSLAILRGLRATVELPHGTAQRAGRELDFPVIGKTGTATDWHGETTDNWFFGGTPSDCMVVWIGRDKKLPLKTTIDAKGQKIQETGGRNALPVFIATMKAAQKDRPKEKFPESTDPHKPFSYKENKDLVNQK